MAEEFPSAVPEIPVANVDEAAGYYEKEVDDLHEIWSRGGAHIVSKPESKPWHLHEFTARDLDGNLLRVFYDFAWELRDRGA